MTYCRSNTLVKTHGQEITASTLRCRAWSCPDCQPLRRWQLVQEAGRGRPNVLITLTIRADDPRPRDEQVLALANAWRVIRRKVIRLRRVAALPFIAVVEQTLTGTPHLHVLARAPWIDQHWLSRQAAVLLNAPIVDIRRIDRHRRVSSYVAKYVAKNPVRIGTTKRYWSSRDYQPAQPAEPHDAGAPRITWRVEKADLTSMIDRYIHWGYNVEIEGTWRFRARPPPEGLWSPRRGVAQ